jgi:hypothetical protein
VRTFDIDEGFPYRNRFFDYRSLWIETYPVNEVKLIPR